MRYRFLSFFTLFFALIVAIATAPTIALAKTMYVSDVLIVTLRDGKGPDHKIIKTLKTDTPVEVLEEDEQYIRAKASTGEIGWILKQYMTVDLPKMKIIDQLSTENDRLKSKLKKFEQDLPPLQKTLEESKLQHAKNAKESEQKIAEAQQVIAQLNEQLNFLADKYETLSEQSQDTLQLINDRDKFRKNNTILVEEVTTLRQENSRMKKNTTIRWFLAGGGVFLVGLLFGKIRTKKKYY
ncbi:MAG: TIGR04211 family SH3 domain-containing protein [Proteobacteria bacterium]|nr:TIGR04211 family SH3 domain-containing protein [Pseudomonadota bacterium]